MTLVKTKTKPRRYQREDILAVQRFRGRALLAHDPGLGKSPITLWWIRDYLGPGNVVIVVQANLKVNWAREAMKHIGRKVVILEGRTPTKFPVPAPKNQIFVINYDILGRPGAENHNWLNWLKRLKPRCVVLDEVQAIKTRDAIRTKACRELCRKVPHVLGLGGTGALENCPAELFPILNMIRPDKWSSFFTYATNHCDPKKTHWGWTFKGATNLRKLRNRLLKHLMIRRRKEDVLADLPPVNRVVVPVTLPPKLMDEYRKAETDFVRWLKTRWAGAGKKTGELSSHRLAQMTHLKKLAEESKLDFFREWLAGWLNDNPKKKVLFFGWHTKFLADMHRSFPNSVLITGKTRQRDRQQMTDKFNTDPSCRMFFGNLLAAGAGWSCTSSSTTVIGGFSWNPALLKQAGGRNHGLGRGVAGEPNFEFIFPTVGTIEEKLMDVLQRKQSIQDQILDGAEEGTSTLNVFDQLTEIYARGKL